MDELLKKILKECECNDIEELESYLSDESYCIRVAQVVVEHYRGGEVETSFAGELSDIMSMVDEDDIPDGDIEDDDGDIVLRDSEGEFTL